MQHTPDKLGGLKGDVSRGTNQIEHVSTSIISNQRKLYAVMNFIISVVKMNILHLESLFQVLRSHILYYY